MQTPVKTAVLFVLAWTLLAVPAAAQKRYVSDEYEIPLRTGAGTQYRIIALIPSGQEVQVVSAGEEWSEVIISGGRQGWALSRYLTERAPAALRLEQLQQKFDKLQADHIELKQNAATLNENNQKLTSELSQVRTDLEQVSRNYETLKTESTEFLKLKTEHDTAIQDLDDARTKAQKAEHELNQLIGNEFNKGLLYGGGLLVFGFIIGFILKRPKRRAPLM